MQDIHNRMPVILAPEHFEPWLSDGTDTADLESLLKPHKGNLTAYKVDKRVGKVRENDEGLRRAYKRIGSLTSSTQTCSTGWRV